VQAEPSARAPAAHIEPSAQPMPAQAETVGASGAVSAAASTLDGDASRTIGTGASSTAGRAIGAAGALAGRAAAASAQSASSAVSAAARTHGADSSLWPSPRRVQALQVEPSPQARQPQPSVQEPVTQTGLSLQPRPEQPEPSEQMPAVLQAGPSVQAMPA
jgi:hypothetical protein